ncbi:hypothetical protein GN277_19165 [Lachnospiraceae bacterium WCA-9-b2]|uniref:Uncharacterized protein n=1 Tax=Sporofaciens musculi TaxID=2681861 RepID=A0A7X3MJ71_9FIRM|nr:hypothetical protein [Sporofaciens musculi]MXP77416.1 hypothetical protein [Sporofaciens musculi]
MEMVLRLRMPGVSTVHCERVARASLLIVFSVLLYCCIRSYGVDFRIMSEDTGVYGGTMMKSCGLVYGEAEPIVGNAGNTPMEMCGQDSKNVTGKMIEEYRQIVGIRGRVEYPEQMNTVDIKDEEVDSWNFGWTEKLWPEKDIWSLENSWDTGIAEPEDNAAVDAPLVDAPPIQEDGEVTDIVDEIRDIGGFLVDRQGYIVGITDSLVLMDGILAIASDEKCVGIKADAFCGVGEDVFEIYIPANICEIEQGAFDGFTNLMYIEVADENPYCYSIDGILYAKYGEEIAYPAGR